MRYDEPELRDALAAEYVLGTLAGPTRRRFQRLLRHDAALQRTVARWEGRLGPLAEAVPAVEPPARVWQALSKHLPGGAPARGGFWSNLAFWRGLGLVNGVAALLLALNVALAPAPEPRHEWVTVMSDERQVPSMLVTWPSQQAARKQITIRVVQEHPQMAQGTSWQLWMVPKPGAKPVPVGLVGIEALQTMVLDERLSGMLPTAWGMAMSVEPEGGSPTGEPTGPILFQGPCVKVAT